MKTIITIITLCFCLLSGFAQTQMKSQLHGTIHETDLKYTNTYVIPGNTEIFVNTNTIEDSLYYCVQYTGTKFYRVPQGNITNASILTKRNTIFLQCPQTIYRETAPPENIIPANTLVKALEYYNNYYTVEYFDQIGYIFCLDIAALYYEDPITIEGWMSYAFIKEIKEPVSTALISHEYCIDTTFFKAIPYEYQHRHIHIYLEDIFGNITLKVIHITD